MLTYSSLTRSSTASIWQFVAIVIAALIARIAPAAPAAGDFPYIAYVAEPETFVRSGPGRNHYPTEQLPAGYAVEVYRHDGNGWCAIRPPEGSFSLAPINQLQLLDQRTARVAGASVAARVGSVLGDEHHAVQVMLDPNETVALLEPPSPTSPWVRIAPPAGEFRWIAARRLSRVPPTESALLVATPAGWQSPAAPVAATSIGRIGMPEPSDDPAAMTGDPFAHLRPTDASQASATALAGRPSNPSWLPTSAPGNADALGATAARANDVPHAGDDLEIIPGSPAAVQQAQYEQAAASPSTSLPSSPPSADAPPNDDASDVAAAPPPLSNPPRIRFEGHAASGPLDPRVAEMQLRLSQIVIGAPASWQFAGLRDETAALLAQEQSPECRGQLRDLLDRIGTFESVQARYRSLPATSQVIASTAAAPPVESDPAVGAAPTSGTADVLARVRSDLGVDRQDNGITPTPGVTPTPQVPGAANAQANYDAVGRLKPVVSRRPNAPQFALINDQGEVVTFVTAAPDVNLQAYVGKRIGIRGSRGFMPEFRRNHVTASRVTPLEEKLIR